MEHIEDSDLIQMSHKLLNAIVDSTDILQSKKLKELDKETQRQKLHEARTVLGFLNAANSTMKTKMQYFRMMEVGEKIEAIKKRKI